MLETIDWVREKPGATPANLAICRRDGCSCVTPAARVAPGWILPSYMDSSWQVSVLYGLLLASFRPIWTPLGKFPSYMDSSWQVSVPEGGGWSTRTSSLPTVGAGRKRASGDDLHARHGGSVTDSPQAAARGRERGDAASKRLRSYIRPLCGDLGLRATMTVAHRRPVQESASGAPGGNRPWTVSVGSRRHVVRSSPEQSLRPERITRRRTPRLGSRRPRRGAPACWPPRRWPC